jgi:hypothetical protein
METIPSKEYSLLKKLIAYLLKEKKLFFWVFVLIIISFFSLTCNSPKNISLPSKRNLDPPYFSKVKPNNKADSSYSYFLSSNYSSNVTPVKINTTKTIWLWPNPGYGMYHFDNIYVHKKPPGTNNYNPISILECNIVTEVNNTILYLGGFDLRFNDPSQIGEWTIKTGYLSQVHLDFYSFNGCSLVCTDPYFCLWAPLPEREYKFDVWNCLPIANITHSPEPAWNKEITIYSNAKDPDCYPCSSTPNADCDSDGDITYIWNIIKRPINSTAELVNPNSANPRIYFSSTRDIGDWTFELIIVDNEGARNTFLHSLTVPIPAPNISITGATDIIASKAPIELKVTPSQDANGGVFEIVWDIWHMPVSTGTSYYYGQDQGSILRIPTTENEIGTWDIKATVTNHAGYQGEASVKVKVHNAPPEINIIGDLNIEALNPIELQANAHDPDGGNLEIIWEIYFTPISTGTVDYYGQDQGPFLRIPESGDPTDAEIGTWYCNVTATDNEGESRSKSITVEVKNLSPILDVKEYPSIISTGQSIFFDASGSMDPDEGELSFQWEILQVPSSHYYNAGDQFSTDKIKIRGDDSNVGTWIFQLTITDNEQESITSEEFLVLVDARPTAVITGPQEPHSSMRELILDGSESVDPDSPCPEQPSLNYCHETVSGRLASASQGIERYNWLLVDVPPELWSEYPTGPINEVFGVDSDQSTLTLPEGTLKTGEWTFQLEVEDDEGNLDFTDFKVVIINPELPPIARITPPARYNTDASGYLSQDILVSGYQSFDLDNVLELEGENPGPGDGIKKYEWSFMQKPYGCPRSIPRGNHSFNLFSAGHIDPRCQGTWKIGLEVTDNDIPPMKSTAETTVLIGNCGEDLCIDAPTSNDPIYVEFSEDTDIFIYYYLNSILYDNSDFLFGMVTKLEIFHEEDVFNPVYTSEDLNVLGSDKGSILSFHWNGYYNRNQSGERPKAGKYHIRISLLNYKGNSIHYVEEERAIMLEVITPVILSSSDKEVDIATLSTGKVVKFDYRIIDGGVVDKITWSVKDPGSIKIAKGELLDPRIEGTFTWDAKDLNGILVPPDYYQLEVCFENRGEIRERINYEFLIYNIIISSPEGTISSTFPGLHIFANIDDDNINNVSDLNDHFITENDLVEIEIKSEPSNLKGAMEISRLSNNPSIRLWDKPEKNSEYPLFSAFESIPTNFFIEGQTSDKGLLSIQFTNEDGELFLTKEIAFTVIELGLIDHQGNIVFHVGIGNWEYGYQGNPPTVLNSADPNNFIEQDLSRFNIVIENPSSNLESNIIEQVQVKIGSFSATNQQIDDLTDVLLVESTSSPGRFVSPSQLLTSKDIQFPNDPAADDEFHAHDGTIGPVPDDVLGDRTHQAEINGFIRIVYQGSMPYPKSTLFPVFQRAPDYRKKVQIRVHVFNEPYEDFGLDGIAGTEDTGEGDNRFTFGDYGLDGIPGTGDPGEGNRIQDLGEVSERYIDFSHGGSGLLPGNAPGVADIRGPIVDTGTVWNQLKRADIGWFQAGIKTELLLPIIVENAPKKEKLDILLDGFTNIPNDLEIIFEEYQNEMDVTILELFFAGPIYGGRGISVAPIVNRADIYPSIGNEEFSFVVLGPNQPIHFRVLAHELGHILTNTAHSPADRFEFYPYWKNISDNTIDTYRRLKQVTIDQARTKRTPSSDLFKPGNTLLKKY